MYTKVRLIIIYNKYGKNSRHNNSRSIIKIILSSLYSEAQRCHILYRVEQESIIIATNMFNINSVKKVKLLMKKICTIYSSSIASGEHA